MLKNPLLLIVIIMAIIAFIIGLVPPSTWSAFPKNILVDTPEDFNWKNTPSGR